MEREIINIYVPGIASQSDDSFLMAVLVSNGHPVKPAYAVYLGIVKMENPGDDEERDKVAQWVAAMSSKQPYKTAVGYCPNIKASEYMT